MIMFWQRNRLFLQKKAFRRTKSFQTTLKKLLPVNKKAKTRNSKESIEKKVDLIFFKIINKSEYSGYEIMKISSFFTHLI